MGYASELGNYAEYSGAPNEEEVLQYARVVIDVRYHPRVKVINYDSSFVLLKNVPYDVIAVCYCGP